jgi:DtxR family Mn-dependent transcriptional regulator
MGRGSSKGAVRKAKPRQTAGTTASVQDYLAAIYDLGGSGKPVIGARLAKHMSVSAPAVTEAIQRIARGGYVKVGPGKALTLTPKGRQIAEVMARRHRLLERWLTDTLGLNWTDAHEEAHRLEHALSPRVEDRLAEMLGMPSTCPHGNPIPGMPRPPRVEPFPLNQAKEGATVVVERITEEAEADKNLLEYLWRNDVRPGRRLSIVEVAPWAGTITAAGDDGPQIALGLPAAAKIWVYLPTDR